MIRVPLKCEPDYGATNNIRTSGSQCSGLSKITTEEECKLAAEYNRMNIDKREDLEAEWWVG